MNNPTINGSSEESSNTAANADKLDIVTDPIEKTISLTSCYWYLAHYIIECLDYVIKINVMIPTALLLVLLVPV